MPVHSLFVQIPSGEVRPCIMQGRSIGAWLGYAQATVFRIGTAAKTNIEDSTFFVVGGMVPY